MKFDCMALQNESYREGKEVEFLTKCRRRRRDRLTGQMSCRNPPNEYRSMIMPCDQTQNARKAMSTRPNISCCMHSACCFMHNTQALCCNQRMVCETPDLHGNKTCVPDVGARPSRAGKCRCHDRVLHRGSL